MDLDRSHLAGGRRDRAGISMAALCVGWHGYRPSSPDHRKRTSVVGPSGGWISSKSSLLPIMRSLYIQINYKCACINFAVNTGAGDKTIRPEGTTGTTLVQTASI